MQIMTQRFTEQLRLLRYSHLETCMICNHRFCENETTHFGYGENELALEVCNDCIDTLVETAVRHVYSKLPYEKPELNTKLWRYMDFTKYVSMLSSSSLFFARADTFDDFYEGAKGVAKNKDKWDSFYLEFFRHALTNPPEGIDLNHDESYIESESKRLLKELEEGGKNIRKRVFINCWHANDYESEAMWRLYAQLFNNAVAIQTTYESLYENIGKKYLIEIGKVKYIDYSKSFAGVNDSFWKKRKSFAHEQEVRAIIHDFETQDLGKLVSCDLNNLIDNVYVSPTAPKWFHKLVEEINLKYGITVPVKQSQLNEEPFF